MYGKTKGTLIMPYRLGKKENYVNDHELYELLRSKELFRQQLELRKSLKRQLRGFSDDQRVNLAHLESKRRVFLQHTFRRNRQNVLNVDKKLQLITVTAVDIPKLIQKEPFETDDLSSKLSRQRWISQRRCVTGTTEMTDGETEVFNNIKSDKSCFKVQPLESTSKFTLFPHICANDQIIKKKSRPFILVTGVGDTHQKCITEILDNASTSPKFLISSSITENKLQQGKTVREYQRPPSCKHTILSLMNDSRKVKR